jgi:peptidoglycan/xylan/chitin deacetylase (PgdA/CDA1 family)
MAAEGQTVSGQRQDPSHQFMAMPTVHTCGMSGLRQRLAVVVTLIGALSGCAQAVPPARVALPLPEIAATPAQPLPSPAHRPVLRHVRILLGAGVRLPTPLPGHMSASIPLAQVRVPPGRGAGVSLTFDDGPSAAVTPSVLALLRRSHVHAVFCLIGLEAARESALVRAEVAAGDQLCDHSRDHNLNMAHLPIWFRRAEVLDGLGQIRQAAPGARVPYYRQPGGLWEPTVVSAASDAGLGVLRWTVDPRDWSRPGTDLIIRRVLAQLQPGAVVLLHDGGGDRRQTLAALGWLLPHLQAAGWRFTLPTLRPIPLALAEQPQ